MLFFNVTHQPKGRSATQYLIGADGDLAKKVACEASSAICKGDTVEIWSIDDKNAQQSQMVCFG